MKITTRFPNHPLTPLRENKNVIIHYHIFKNAGTTINGILQRHFGAAYGEYDGKKLARVIQQDALLSFILRNPHLKVVSSHNARLPVPQYPGVTFYPIIFLRHPIDRIGSMYAFERRQPPGTTNTSKFAHENSFARYVAFFMRNSKFFMRNFQTHYLSGKYLHNRYKKSIAKPMDLYIAQTRLESLPFFGMVEYFDESMCLMQDYLMDGFGPIVIDYTVENKSPGRKSTLEERLASIKAELPPKIYQELEARNSMDLKLFEFGKNLFLERAAKRKLLPVAEAN
jgi:hypothetical protein